MKKILLSSAMVAVLGVVAAPSAFAAATITFKGELLDGTCVVTPGAGVTGTPADMIVQLAHVPAADLAAANSWAGTTPFEIKVGGNAGDTCNGKATQLFFEDIAGSSMINADGNLDKSVGTATNVGFRLLNGTNDAVVNLKTRANNPTATPVAGTPGVLAYKAQYFSKTGSATAGTVESYVMYTVTY